MRRWMWLALALAALVPPLRAADKEAPRKGEASKEAGKHPPKLADQLEGLQKDLDHMAGPIQKEYMQAKSADARKKILERYRAAAQEKTGHALELAEKLPDDPAALSALLWVVSTYAGGGTTPEREKALAIMARDHTAGPRAVEICQSLLGGSPGVETYVRAVLEKNPAHDAQGQAALVLARAYKARSDAQLAAHEPEAAATLGKAEKSFALVIQKYGDVKDGRRTLKERAEGDLFEMRRLALGKVAPDIEGEDSSGKRFKLSDYRGKVVVLDFWARW